MTNETDLSQRVKAIEDRNADVTLDKAWETSLTRKVAITALTYTVVVVYLHMINNDNPWINAIVPPTGFLLSTLALGWLRKSWQRSNS